MSPEQARQLIAQLADGVDPETGEMLPDHHLLNQPQVLRAMVLAAQALHAQVQSLARARPAPAKAGLPWSSDEEQRLGSEFDQGLSMAELMQAHQRSRGAITARLLKLGRVRA
ncbi:hypothetical protein [Pelomonas sp. SE-A7]|uniref:hypothetical protein n=1 Tax=Pelomonas sp. SE-A7 TaxID=3054953 RepID=UPI00259CE1BE|nr:hypothetical protein [Pelomonas sp. SE-A7]MDM4767168.1 hypothetical protein [Pelomonas sp. SE-A7]